RLGLVSHDLRPFYRGLTSRRPSGAITRPTRSFDLGGRTMKVKLLVLGLAGMLAVAAAASAARLDVIHGTPGADTLAGPSGPDLIYAGAGNDLVRSHGGNDVVYGGTGNDVTWPGAGVDVQYGGRGNDVLHALADDNQPDI